MISLNVIFIGNPVEESKERLVPRKERALYQIICYS